jgi:glycosyltransferase involved in cell wall biosynthesis
MFISVIIATKNRSEAIENISLPSLLRQDSADFEILIWDASDDELTKRVVDEARHSFVEREIDLIYEYAPRAGSVSQRNDAVREARGDVVLFLDDDSEASSDAIGVVKHYFDDFAWLQGLGLPLIDKLARIDKYVAHPVIGMLRDVAYSFFFGRQSNTRNIRNSTRNNMPPLDAPGKAEWLTGADMAFRKSVFEKNEFDERLQLFGGYAFGEDYDFSHRIFLRYGEPLLVASSGCVVHHNAGGGRIPDHVNFCAARFHNTAIIRENFGKYRSYRLLPFIWELRVGMVLSMLAQKISPNDIWRAYRAYKREKQ